MGSICCFEQLEIRDRDDSLPVSDGMKRGTLGLGRCIAQLLRHLYLVVELVARSLHASTMPAVHQVGVGRWSRGFPAAVSVPS